MTRKDAILRHAWMVLLVFQPAGHSTAQNQPPEPPQPPFKDTPRGADKPEAPAAETFYIRHYRIKGAKELPPVDIESAVYPFMGPACTIEHVEKARAALEKAYHDKGYKTVSVTIPQQEQSRHGIVKLEVSEGRVGRLRVRGSRYFSLEKIKAGVPSLAEGSLPNFKQVEKEILALNRNPDRQVTPAVNAGVEPGTFDVDLTVKDKLPLHGSLELNNRYSPDTTELRLNAAISYGNLWQAGHTLGLSAQIAPERPEDAKVFSAFYTIPVPSVDGLSLTFNGTKQDSDINTLGGAAVAGRGYILGARASKTMSGTDGWFHGLNAGFDFKHFDQNITVGETEVAAPIDYVPFSAGYSGTYAGKTHSTDINASLVFNIRGLGSDTEDFDDKRFRASGNFVYGRADISHTRDLRNGMQWFGKLQGQISSGALVNSEQFSGGGLGSVRGYPESAALGDNAIAGSLEVRTPSLIRSGLPEGEAQMRAVRPPNEWRLYGFVDAAYLTNYDPLPEQDSSFPLVSVGLGSRFRLRDHYNGSVDVAFPLLEQGTSDAGDVFVTFRVWSDF